MKWLFDLITGLIKGKFTGNLKINFFIRRSYGGAQPNISQELIRETYIPLLPMEAQQHIAAELKEEMALVTKSRKAIENQLEAINVLPQAILRKAFRGEL